MSYQLTSTVLGILLASIILWLIRRDLLHSRHALWWMMMALVIVLLSLFPRAIDMLAAKLGVHYPPTLLFVSGMSLILIKVLLIDLQQSLMERRLRRLAQRLAILEGEQQSNSNVSDSDKE